MSNNVKQVIVMRHDLNMRKGKYAAQASHASMAFLSRRIQAGLQKKSWELKRGISVIRNILGIKPPEEEWLTGSFAKVVCKVDSEEELLKIFESAKKAGLEVHLITDSGRTEFGGVPTRTCLAIGPDNASRIDPVTGHLTLA